MMIQPLERFFCLHLQFGPISHIPKQSSKLLHNFVQPKYTTRLFLKQTLHNGSKLTRTFSFPFQECCQNRQVYHTSHRDSSRGDFCWLSSNGLNFLDHPTNRNRSSLVSPHFVGLSWIILHSLLYILHIYYTYIYIIHIYIYIQYTHIYIHIIVIYSNIINVIYTYMGELTPETLTSEYQWIIFSGIPVFPRSPPSSSQVSGRRNLNVCPLTPRSLEATEHFTGDAWGTSFPRIYWENIMVYYGILLMNIMVYYG